MAKEQLQLEAIISGGQTGADQAGLIAGAGLLLKTGGWAPKGWRTEAGPAPWLQSYNLEEHSSSNYQDRTTDNALASDGTVLFGYPGSAGSLLTRNVCEQGGIPLILFETGTNWNSKDLIAFLKRHAVVTLNVAGNRESVNPGLHARVFTFLMNTLWISIGSNNIT